MQRGGLGGAAVLAAGRRRLAGSHAPRHAPRRPRTSRCATSASTRPTPTPAGPASGSRPSPSGSTPPAAVAVEGAFLDSGSLHPTGAGAPTGGLRQLFGDCWEWTASAYRPYPGFRPAAGAIGEYNGKFMATSTCCGAAACSRRPATRGRRTATSSISTPRWQCSGVRLAEDDGRDWTAGRSGSTTTCRSSDSASSTLLDEVAPGADAPSQDPVAALAVRRPRQRAVRRDHSAARVLPDRGRALDPPGTSAATSWR